MSKKILSMILAALMLLTVLAGCAAKDDAATDDAANNDAANTDAATDDAANADTDDSADDEKWIIGLEYSASSCEFCQNFANVTKEYGEAAGFEVILTQGNRSVTNQMTNVEAMLAQGCKIVGGFWDEPGACLPVADACEEAGVWCIGVLCPLENRANGYEKYRFVGSENYNAGYMMGTSAAENLPENAKVCVMGGPSTDQQVIDRFDGFWAALEEAGRDDVTVLDTQYKSHNREDGLMIAENWTQAYGDEMQAIIASSDEIGCPAVEALKSADLIDQVQVYSIDGSANAIQMILDGEMVCSVLQDYKAQAQGYIDLCVSIRDTGDSEDVDVPFTLIDASNAEEYLNY